MSRIIKSSLYYFLIFSPSVVLAQISSSSSGMGAPDTVPLASITQNFLFWILGGIGVLSFLGLPMAGIMFVAAAADHDRVAKAGGVFAASIVGLIISILGLIILSYAQGALGG